MNISKILAEKFKNNEAGHFYILNPDHITQDNALTDWTKDLISKIMSDTKQFNSENIINHEDFLYLSKEDKGAAPYKLADFNDFFSFLTYSATRYKRKIVLIDNAQRISVSVANKLLKTLEEPPIESTIIMLNPQKVSLLETIKSRAIKLSIPLEKSKQSMELIETLVKEIKAGTTFDEFALSFKGNKQKEIQLFKELNKWAVDLNLNAMQLTKLDYINKQTIEDHTFNSPALNRLHKIFFLIKETIDG